MGLTVDVKCVLYCLFFLEQLTRLQGNEPAGWTQLILQILSYECPILFLERLAAYKLVHLLFEQSVPILYSYLHS